MAPSTQTMASQDDKTATATLVRGFNKRVGRTKEIVLQNLGKVDKTEDEAFDHYVGNFSKQQSNATKLQKYMGNYITAVRTVVHASIAFQDSLKEVYEDDWAGKFELITNLDHMKSYSHEYLRELDKSSTALYSYQAQFPDMRSKIEKRNRKLVDYDATRHTIQQLQTSKKRDDTKLVKAEEKNADAKRLYDHLNTELHDLLPALFDSRIVSYGSMLQSLFTAESTYHGEISKLNTNLSEVIDKLVEERGRGTYTSKRTSEVASNGPLPGMLEAGISVPVINGEVAAPATPAPSPASPADLVAAEATPGASPKAATPISASPAAPVEAPAAAPEPEAAVAAPAEVPVAAPAEAAPAAAAEEPVVESKPEVTPAAAAEATVDESKPEEAPAVAAAEVAPAAPVAVEVDVSSGESDGAAVSIVAAPIAQGEEDKDIYTVPTNNKAPPLPTGVLKRVLATHPYTGEDEDELSFGANEVFCVLPYEDPEEAEKVKKKQKVQPPKAEQDDGWYFGFVEGKPDVKGVFPANFTRPVDP